MAVILLICCEVGFLGVLISLGFILRGLYRDQRELEDIIKKREMIFRESLDRILDEYHGDK